MDTAHIIVPVADIYREHTFASEVITQALLYEKVTILDTYGNWSRIEQWDDYRGWINNFYLDKNSNFDNYSCFTNHSSFLALFRTIDEKFSNPLFIPQVIPYGVRVPILERKGDWFKIPFKKFEGDDFSWVNPMIQEKRDNKRYENLYSIMSKSGLSPNSTDDFRDRLINDMFALIGVPYKWGGKSSFGFDCSGLLQSLFKSNGISMPRDSKDQYERVKNNEISIEESLDGDLLFFGDNGNIEHVAISADYHCHGNTQFFTHCSGMVKENSLDEEDGLFDKKLMDKFIGIFSVSEIIKEQLNERK